MKRIKIEATVDDDAIGGLAGDIAIAIGLVDATNFSMSINDILDTNALAAAENNTQPARLPTQIKYAADIRLVWDTDNRRINVQATLGKMGLTWTDLMSMHTRHGTLENAVKNAGNRLGMPNS